jgi:indolepyruvate ferredoxin oxidoreductase
VKTEDASATARPVQILDIRYGRPELARLMAARVSDLVAYQGQKYADGYHKIVYQTLVAERRLTSGSPILTLAVARNLFKLMAYEDEYEAARLCLNRGLTERVRRELTHRAKATGSLHPLVLRALRLAGDGLWIRWAFQTLYSMRRLRGTPFDVFGYAKVRRLECQLVNDYLDMWHYVLCNLNCRDLADAVVLAGLPELVHGYQEVKLRSVERYHAELKLSLDRFRRSGNVRPFQR